MLFYYKYEKQDELPELYLKILISNDIEDNLENSIRIKELFPKSKNSNKYKDQLKYSEEYVTMIIKFMQKSNNIVIVYSKEEEEYLGFDFHKYLIKHIEKLYDIKIFKYTSNITLKMIEQSQINNIKLFKKNKKKLKCSIKKGKDNIDI